VRRGKHLLFGGFSSLSYYRHSVQGPLALRASEGFARETEPSFLNLTTKCDP
jgi:hypothetical protein